MSARDAGQTRHGLRPAVRADLTKTFLLHFSLLLMLPLDSPPLRGVAASSSSSEARYIRGSGSEGREEMHVIRRREDGGLYQRTTYSDVIGGVTHSLDANENTPEVVVPTSENEPDVPPSFSESMKKHNDFWVEAILSSDYSRDYENSSSQPTFQAVELDEEEEDFVVTEKEERKIQQLVYDDNLYSDTKPKNINKNCECGSYNSPSARIVNGQETAPNEYPWMVSIQIKKDHFHNCGGSIISDWYVLTAAHCTDGWLAEELLIRAGDHDLTANDVSRQKDIDIEEIIQHEDYNVDNTNNDISLLKLSEQLQLTWRVNPICLTPYDLTYYGETVEVMGWGKMNSKDKLGSPVLMQTTLKLITMKSCRYNFKLGSDEITSKMMCGTGDKTDACQGDSGGPLVWKDKTNDRYFIIGITSWGVGCALPNYPGVYTKLIRFVDWIYFHTQDSTFCSSFSPKAAGKKRKKKNKKKEEEKKKKNVGKGNTKSKKQKLKKPEEGGKNSEGVSLKDKKGIRKDGNRIKRRDKTKKRKKKKNGKKKKKKRKGKKKSKKKKKERKLERQEKRKDKRKKIRKKLRKKIRQKLGNVKSMVIINDFD